MRRRVNGAAASKPVLPFTPAARKMRIPHVHIPNTRISRGLRRLPRRFSRLRLSGLSRMFNRYFFRLCVLAGLLLLFVGLWSWLRPGARIRVDSDLVAAFQMPHRAIGLLQDYAAAHGVPFAELLVIFNAENGFFPDRTLTFDLSQIESLYLRDFDRLRRRYNTRSITPYVTMFNNLFAEIEAFPIPSGWYDGDPGIMFGNTWGIDHNQQGNRKHLGVSILCRENLRGRVPVVSMTHGRVEEAGWNNQLGYFVGITTINGTYYLYAHLDRLAPNLQAGQLVSAGHALGYMGNTGGGRGNNNFAVHLHIGISPDVDFTRGRFWINPYPFLRHLEAQNAAQ